MQIDLIIRGGLVLDGHGNPAVRSDIGVREGRIAVITRRTGELQNARCVLEADGCYVAPGFIDLHTHTDYSILLHPDARSSLHMGVTTEGVGQCGGSAYPIGGEYASTLQGWFRMLGGGAVDIDWNTLQGWRERVEGQGTGINIAPYVGHNTLREIAMGREGEGGEAYLPTEEQVSEMCCLLAEAMEEGAFGLSTGLRYPLGRNATTEEVVELCRTAAEYGGVYISHLRSESERLNWSVRELLQISRKAQLPACITHHKASLPENWGKLGETTRMVSRAHEEGLPIFIDFYPWRHGRQANLGSLLVSYALANGKDQQPPTISELLEQLEDEQRWKETKGGVEAAYQQQVEAKRQRRRELKPHGVAVPELWPPADFDRIVHSRTHPEVVGLTLAETAAVVGVDHYLDAARLLYLEDRGETFVAAGEMSQHDIRTLLRHPAAAISTDGWTLDTRPDGMRVEAVTAHPRQFGTYPKVLGSYVRDERILTLPDAVRKMTSLPAGFLGLNDRGALREGAWADIVVFDLDKVDCTANYSNPASYPTGMRHVLVNGQPAVQEGQRTEARPGKVLRRG